MLDMQYVSKNKITLLIALFVVVACLAAYVELYVKPSLASDNQELRNTTSELTKTQNDNLNIEDELVFLRENKDKFGVLKSSGFFESQEREIVQNAVDEAMRLSGIIGGNFKVSPPACYINNDLKDSDYVLLASPVTIDADSYEDLSTYQFLDYFIRKLPGYVVIENFNIQRTQGVTRSLLQEIGAGQKVPLIESEFVLTWYTIVERSTLQCSGLRNR